jgi:hypothetical protein
LPPVTIDPARFADKPLSRKPTCEGAENDYRVMIDGMTAGRIMLSTLAGSIPKWGWSLTGPYLPPELEPGNGYEETLEHAQEAFKAKFWEWHRWAQDQAGGAAWIV